MGLATTMFKSLKLYTGATISLGNILATLVDFGYKRQETVLEEGDFARRGEIFDIFPFAFELPIRIELNMDEIASIKTFNPVDGIPVWEHKMLIILSVKKVHAFKTATFTEDLPVESFVDLNIGDYVVHTQHGIGRFLGLDKIKVGDKKYRTILVEPIMREEGIFSAKGSILVWLTDDKRRIPVRMSSKVLIGSVTVDLIEIRR